MQLSSKLKKLNKFYFINFSLLSIFILPGCESVFENEEDISLNQLPANIRSQIEREVGSGVIIEIERKGILGWVSYEIEYTKEGEFWEIEINRNGEVTERERNQ